MKGVTRGLRANGAGGPVSQIVARNTRIFREKGGITQAQLAERLGVDPATMSKIEHGFRLISIDEALMIAGILGVEFSVLSTPINPCERCGGTGIEPAT